MAHLKSFGLENFRVFKDMTELKFAPITVFTGANSSGKSSVIKALLLLKDNISKDLITEDKVSLDFTKGFHHLSNFNESKNRNSNKKEMKFRLPFTFLFIQDKMTIEITFILDESNEIKNGTMVKLEVFSSDGKPLISFSKNEKTWKPVIKFSYFRKEFDKFLINFRSNEENERRKKFLDSKDELTKDEQKELKRLKVEIEDFDFSKFTRYKKKPLLHAPFSFLSYDKDDFIIFLSKGGFNSIGNKTLKGLGIDLNKISDYEYIYSHLKSKCEDFANDTITKVGNKNINSIESLLWIIYEAESIGLECTSLKPAENEFKEMNSIAKKFKSYLMSMLSECKNREFIDISTGVIQNFDVNNHAIYEYYINITKCILSIRKEKEEFNVLYDLISKINQNVGLDPLREYFDKSSEIGKLYMGYNPLKKYFDQYIRKGFINSAKKALGVFQNINFVEAVRANTQRYYSYSSQGTSFNDLLREYSLIGFDSESAEKGFVNKWLNEFEIGSELVTSIIEGYGSKVSVDKTNLADLGYGVSQFLPLLIKIAVIARNKYDIMPLYDNLGVMNDWPNNYYSSILIVEEPETNLHPKLQSKLADMFVDAAKKFNIQFIIETHSEYLIRKLQYLTAKNEIKPEDTVIYYFHNPNKITEGEKQVKKIKIKDNGLLDGSFGRGFIDEASMLIREIFKISGAN